MSELYLGSKFKEKKAKNIEKYLLKALAEGEYIKGIFYANKIMPLVDFIVITNQRLICGTYSKIKNETGVGTEIAGDLVASAVAESAHRTAGLVPLKITSPTGQETKVASIKKDDADVVIKYLTEMEGSPISISEGMKAYEARNIAKQAAMIRAIERSEDERSDADNALLATDDGKEMIKKANEALVAKHNSSQNVTGKGGARGGVCPRCGSDRLQAIQEINTKGVDTTASAAGCCCLGPIGLLCGLPGAGKSSTKTMRMCLNCGKKFQ